MKNIKLIIYSLITLILILNNVAIARTWSLGGSCLRHNSIDNTAYFDWHKIPIVPDRVYGEWECYEKGKKTYLHAWQKDYENDTFYITQAALSYAETYKKFDYLKINGTFDVTMKGLLVESTKKGFLFRFSDNNITIKKLLNLGDVRYAEMTGKTISVGRDLVAAEDMHVHVKNNMVTKTLSTDWESTFTFKSENGGTLETPSLTVIDSVGNNVYLKITPLLTKDMYVNLGGLNVHANLEIKQLYLPNSAKLPPKKTVYVSLNPKEDYYCTGSFGERLNHWNPPTKLAVIMNGKGQQHFSTDHSCFTGGVKMLNGTLRFNFNQDRKKYSYKVGNSEDYYDYVCPSTPTHIFPPTTASHGDLEMIGGTFGSIKNNHSYGAFRFTNIIYTNGTVNLRLAGPDKMDSIDLTTFYGQYNKYIKKGMYRLDLNEIKGGKISFAKNAKRFYFQFDEDLSWLISDVFNKVNINDGKGAKVISWDNGKNAGLSKDSFAANLFKSKNGKMYKPDFTVGNKGLYVKYVPVPEISQITAIIGALALTFAAIRKRKGKN